MKKYIKSGIALVALVGIVIYGLSAFPVDAEPNSKVHNIEKYIEEQQKISQIPGISLVIVEKGQTVYQQGFGYANLETKQPVTAETRFEIGSTTKAFTGLAILQLAKEGMLNRTDDVQSYIPWFKLNYNGKPQTITINQLLYHTSGIAFQSIAHIPESNQENALELTVRTLVGQELDREPGSSMQYATINYDVLGLIIEAVTEKPYDQYIKQKILEPIGMNDSLVGRHQVQSAEVATGYKLGFMQAQAYEAPIYRGNVPAGYLISSTNDIAKWMNFQLGVGSDHETDQQIVQLSHIPDSSVEPFDKDSYYGSGWVIHKKRDKTYILHEGANPNFTSYFILQPEEQVGVAILSNMNTSYTTAIGQGVLDLWEGNDVNTHHTDMFQELDKILTLVCIVLGCCSALFIVFIVSMIRNLAKKERIWNSLNVRRSNSFLVHTIAAVAVTECIIILPPIFMGGLSWSFVKVWAPTTVSVSLYSTFITISLYYLYVILRSFTHKTTSQNK